MLDFKLYLLQRLSALVMAPFVFVHLGVMIYAIQGGLTASEILGRTQGSLLWFLFYGLFVLAVSVHAAIGLRVVLYETMGIAGRLLSALTVIVFIGLLLPGMYAVFAVTAL